MSTRETFRATGTYMDMRFAFIRADFDEEVHGNEVSFYQLDPPIFQTPGGDIDQWAQGSLIRFGFDEPFDGTALSADHSLNLGAVGAVLEAARDKELRLKATALLSKKLSNSAKLNKAVAAIAQVFWEADDVDEFEESLADELESGDFETHVQDGDTSISIDDVEGGAQRWQGALLIEARLADGIECTVGQDGTVEAGEIDWEESAISKVLLLLKPRFAVGMPAAE